MASKKPEAFQILEDVLQPHSVRAKLLKQWSETHDKRNVIAYFSCFDDVPDAMVMDTDRDSIESILQKMDFSKPLDLIINSPGGLPLAAERIINVCRTYSSEFRVIVPKLAKSAATMIAFGANSILLPETAELGPIDPQMPYLDSRGKLVYRPAYAIIKGVQDILAEIRKLGPDQKVEGLLSLMPPIDQAFLRHCESAQKLATDIAVRYLKITTFNNSTPQLTDKQIQKKIEKFINPELNFSHGRPIMYAEALRMGLKVVKIDKSSPDWDLLLRIYHRYDHIVSRTLTVKLIESPLYQFARTLQR